MLLKQMFYTGQVIGFLTLIWVADYYGRKPVLVAGMLLSFIGTFVSALMPTI